MYKGLAIQYIMYIWKRVLVFPEVPPKEHTILIFRINCYLINIDSQTAEISINIFLFKILKMLEDYFEENKSEQFFKKQLI